MFWKRIMAAIIDCIFVSIVLFVISNIIITNLINGDINSQALPFISFQAVLSPFGMIQHVIEYPRSLGITLSQLIFLLTTLFICEVIIYSAFELSPLKKTIGKCCLNIKYDNGLSFKKALLRNSVKVISRYLFGLPLIVIFFTKHEQAIHDLLAKTVVISSQGKTREDGSVDN